MCGIVGIVAFDRSTRLAPSIHRMARALQHRGPDDEGYLLADDRGATKLYFGDSTPERAREQVHIEQAPERPQRLAFGHRRLSILDTSSAGHQPMSYAGRYWIVYNGELYNFIELRAQLQSLGYRFHSTSDTEVVLAAYDHWGASCVERFNGMWAFAIYDAKLQRLALSRDQFGIKPLYTYVDKHKFIFASEMKAILEADGVVATPNLEYCSHFIAEGAREYIAETAFNGISRFPHASIVECELAALSRALHPKPYWFVEPDNRIERFQHDRAQVYAEEFRDLLDDSVRLRLRADVRVGSSLSGGLDSSAIVYLVNKQLRAANLKEQQETFSSVYKTTGVTYCDESDYIEQLAHKFDLHTNQIEPRVEDVVAEHMNVVRALETPLPVLHLGGWYTFKLAASRGVKVTLDGQGADELLGGYLLYLGNYFLDLPLRRAFEEVNNFRSVPGGLNKFVYVGLASNLLRRAIGRTGAASLMAKGIELVGAKNPRLHVAQLNSALHNTMTTELVNLLQYGDGVSMAHSVESRLPFLDHRLVEFLARVPAVYKIHGGWTKYIMRIAMDGQLPDSITWRKDKMGWPDPVDYWFRGALREHLCSTVETSRFLRDMGVGHDVRTRLANGESIHKVIRLYNLAVWHDTFFGVSRSYGQRTVATS
jgi:asparagine synthase (glutamine-hydrolysing)